MKFVFDNTVIMATIWLYLNISPYAEFLINR